MTEKIQQHYIPRVYLKHFQIDDQLNKNFVYCIDFSNKYNLNPQKKGINDKVFKEKKFYNDKRLINPFAIEDILGQEFEPKYDKIIKTISEEKYIKKEIVEDLIVWLYISKMRSPFIRLNNEYFLEKFISITNNFNNHNPNDSEKEVIKTYIKQKSKDGHLNQFSDIKQAEELINLFLNTLGSKHWRILKSNPIFPFWTNDNPGFSPNLNPLFAKSTPFHRVMELNSDSIIYYVLSPKYCIEISPFEINTPLTLNAFNMNIKYEMATFSQIDFINRGVFYSRLRLIISNSKALLESCVVNK